MMNKKQVIVVVAFVALLFGAMAWLFSRAMSRQQETIERLESNIKSLTTEMSIDRSKDGKQTATILQQTLTKAEIKELLHEELKSLSIKERDVKQATTIASENKAVVKLDTVLIHDTLRAYEYYDDWLQISVINDSAKVSVFDSILVVNHAKTRKFLWWTWKRYSGKTTIKNYSPYSTIRTINAIEIEK